MNVKLLTENHLEFLSLKGGCTGFSESTLFKMPHCWKSHVTAHYYLVCLFVCLCVCLFSISKNSITAVVGRYFISYVKTSAQWSTILPAMTNFNVNH